MVFRGVRFVPTARRASKNGDSTSAVAGEVTAATALTAAAARRKMGERRMEAGAGVGVATRPEAGLATPTGRSPAPPACLPPPP